METHANGDQKNVEKERQPFNERETPQREKYENEPFFRYGYKRKHVIPEKQNDVTGQSNIDILLNIQNGAILLR